MTCSLDVFCTQYIWGDAKDARWVPYAGTDIATKAMAVCRMPVSCKRIDLLRILVLAYAEYAKDPDDYFFMESKVNESRVDSRAIQPIVARRWVK